MFAIDLGGGAELRPLEPWQVEEFLAHMDRAREAVEPWVPWADVNHDLASATATLQRYADQAARDGRRVYGIWLGGTMFVGFDATSGAANCWLVGALQCSLALFD